MIIIADSSGLIAAFNRSDPEHSAAAKALNNAGYVVISPLALAEIDYVVASRTSRNAADWALGQVRSWVEAQRATLAAIDGSTLGNALAVRERYRELKLDIADAVNVALAAQFRTINVLTLDRRDFRDIRPLTGQAAFRLLPDDDLPEY